MAPAFVAASQPLWTSSASPASTETPLRFGDGGEFVAGDRVLAGDVGYSAVPRHVDQHTLGDDAAIPVRDVGEVGALGRDLFGVVSPLPHAVLVPDVAHGVDVGHRRPVVDEPKIVHHIAPAGSEGTFSDEVLWRLKGTTE